MHYVRKKKKYTHILSNDRKLLWTCLLSTCPNTCPLTCESGRFLITAKPSHHIQLYLCNFPPPNLGYRCACMFTVQIINWEGKKALSGLETFPCFFYFLICLCTLALSLLIIPPVVCGVDSRCFLDSITSVIYHIPSAFWPTTWNSWSYPFVE